MNNLSASAFWFGVCSMYFPYCINDLLTKEKEELEDVFHHCIDRVTSPLFPVRMIKNNSRISKKKTFIADLLSYKEYKDNNEFKSKQIFSGGSINGDSNQMSIDELINIMDCSLKELSVVNKLTSDTIIKEMLRNPDENYLCVSSTESKSFSASTLDLDNILLDLIYNSNTRNDYLKYLLEKQKNDVCDDTFIKMKIEEEIYARKVISCMVCNDSDNSATDRILICQVS